VDERRESPDRPLAVSEVVARLRKRLELEFAALRVAGEIGSLHRSRLGHWYFDLKDEGAQLRAVLFRATAARLPFEPEEGMAVVASGRLDVFEERGILQLIVDALEPRGEGALRAAFEQLRRRLDAEGLFDPTRKRKLPFFPARVGLVTSSGGAALHDFLRGLRRRGASLEVVLYDARVQGELAWREVVRGLHLLDADPSIDLVVLARGGGSLEDLWTFNREEVVRAVFEASHPVVSAIGHETDVVLTDLVADARAATPTAAAELIAPDVHALRARTGELRTRLVARIAGSLRTLELRLEALRRGLVHPVQRLVVAETRLAHLHARLASAAAVGLSRREAALAAAGARLDALSPLGVLGRGYGIARRRADGRILRASSEVARGEGIRVDLARGALHATVDESLPAEDR
jgi:exodeoxyribonuclease VII large subunit